MFKLTASSPKLYGSVFIGSRLFLQERLTLQCLIDCGFGLEFGSPDGGIQVFEVYELSGATSKLVDVSTLDAGVRKQCTITSNYVLPQNFDVLLKATAYLAASALRLITKPSENYSRSWGHILEGYQKIYETKFPIRGFRPNDECLYWMKLLLQNTKVIRHSMGYFLYSFEPLKAQDKRTCRILYEQHFTCTGMHAYPLFISACSKLNMSLGKLLVCLSHRMTRDGLETIVALLNHHECPEDVETKRARARKTWRYARLFSDAAFSRLQTKNCTMLVLILAHLNRLLGTKGADDVLKIKQIVDMGDEADQWHAEVASRIYSSRKQ